MAPKAEKKPAQPAKKAVAKKSGGGRKKGSKKAVESYKIYIYKVHPESPLIATTDACYTSFQCSASIAILLRCFLHLCRS